MGINKTAVGMMTLALARSKTGMMTKTVCSGLSVLRDDY